MKRFRFDWSEDLADLMLRTGDIWYVTRDGFADQFKLDGNESRLFVTEFVVTDGDEPWETYTSTIVEIVMDEKYTESGEVVPPSEVELEIEKRFGGSKS